MKKDIFRPILKSKDEIVENIIGYHKKEYYDYTASGLAFKLIEDRIQEVLLTYANTHSKEAKMAGTTSDYYLNARVNLHKSFELSEEFVILPSGCGSTAAIKHFQELLGIFIPPATRKRLKLCVDKKTLPLVVVGPYEHHSNEISYREALCEVKRVSLNSEGLIDLDHLQEILEQNRDREIIGAFCVASNVTGIITPYEKISKLLREYGAVVCFDSAAASPYMNIPCELYDVLVCSPHKLLGGPGSCGLLIIKKALIDTTIAPTFAGGGTVRYVNKFEQDYEKEITVREDAGTPGILQLIRASLAYQLRHEIGFEYIKDKKDELLKLLIEELKKIPKIQIYGNLSASNIGIVSFNIQGINPYELCFELSNKSNLQTRAGCSCAGPYGHDLLGIKDKISMDEKPGWVRIGVHYSQTKEDIKQLVEAIKEIIG